MSVQIIIEDKHSTDVLSESKTLSEALSPSPLVKEEDGMARAKDLVVRGMNGAAETVLGPLGTEIVQPDEPEEEVAEIVENTPVETAPRALNPREHKKVADKMIADREMDTELFGLLNEKHAKRVSEAFVKFSEEDAAEFEKETGLSTDPEVGLFDAPAENPVIDDQIADTEAPEEPERDVDLLITPDSLRDLIKKVAVDAEGKDDPAKYAKVSELLTNAIPKGVDIKISNIPVDKVEDVYYEIAAI